MPDVDYKKLAGTIINDPKLCAKLGEAVEEAKHARRVRPESGGVNARYSDAELAFMDQDMLLLQVGDYFLDVGWYPDGDPDGTFVCRIVKGPDPEPEAFLAENALDNFKTRNPIDVLAWLKNAEVRCRAAKLHGIVVESLSNFVATGEP